MKQFLLPAFFCTASLALADGPGPEYQKAGEDDTTSPDGTIVVQQYCRPGDSYNFQFWTFDQQGHHPHLLNPGETDTAYPAAFRFTSDSQWLIRAQKLAAGESTLFLYRRVRDMFATATAKPFGDLVWNFFLSQPEAKSIGKAELSRETFLLRGIADNFASLGEHWPPNRYLALGLSSGESGTLPVGPWHCAYDLQTGKFFVPPDFAAFNRQHQPWK